LDEAIELRGLKLVGASAPISEPQRRKTMQIKKAGMGTHPQEIQGK
jgi:hypothetical protein